MMINKSNFMNSDQHSWIKLMVDEKENVSTDNQISLYQTCKWSCDDYRVHFGNNKFITSNLNHRDKIESGYESMCNANDMEVIKPSYCVENKQDLQVTENNTNILVKIRESIETFVEELLGTSLDSAHVDKPYHHPKYTQHLNQFKDRLSITIFDLTESLLLALQDQTVDEDNTPAAAYSRFKKLFLTITEASSQLPQLPLNQFKDYEDESDESSSYEDLLALAIINELVAIGQANLFLKQNSKESMFDSSNTSINVETQSEVKEPENSSLDSIYSHNNHPNKTCEPGLIMEEEIEEIITTKSFSGSNEDLSNNTKTIVDLFGLNINFNETFDKVSFPEMGIDFLNANQILKENQENEESKENKKSESGLKLIDSFFWEENWLFRKKSKSANEDVLQYYLVNLQEFNNPILMYIPNPSQMINPKIGIRSVDELSELSEHNSVGSLNFSSSSENEDLENETKLRKKDGINFVNNIDGTIKKVIKKSFKKSPKKMYCTNFDFLNSKSSPNFVSQQDRKPNQASTDPCFVIYPQSASVQCNILIQFCCKVKGTLPMGVRWFKQEKLLTESERIRMFKHFNQYILEIKNTQEDDSGEYSCVVFNHLNQSWCDFKIQVKVNHKRNGRIEKPHRSKFQIKKKLGSSQVVKEVKSESVENLSQQKNGVALSPVPGTIAEREHRKWQESNVNWPENPYTSENIEKRKHLSLLCDSIENEPKMTEDQENLCSLPYVSPSKDLIRFKRDYYVSNLNKESINGFEEKVYLDQNVFSLESNQSLENQTQDKIKEKKKFKEKENDLLCQSQNNVITDNDVSSMISVRKLIHKFSDISNGNENTLNNAKTDESNNLKTKSKFCSTKLNYNVQSITGRRMTKEFLNFSAKNLSKNANKPGSLNIIETNHDQGVKAIQSFTPIDLVKEKSVDNLNQSNPNQEYKGEKIKKVNRSLAPSILQKATFWEKKCEESI